MRELTPHEKDLIKAALSVRENAYAPYSKFRVGAAIQAVDGKVYTGCNVENASFGATVCAERNALASAIASGCREFGLLVVATNLETPAAPCGLCRQVLTEFGNDLRIILCNTNNQQIQTQLSDLLPMAFTKESSALL